MVKRLLWTLVVALAGCGGPGGSGYGAPPANANAPGWARAGDERDGKDHLFVCQGAGKTEADALAAAGALCDDKICKLCGVHIESVLKAREDLKGIEVERKVVERCRMTRTSAPEVTRKSVDCGPDGCLAWTQVRWTEAQKADSCKRLEDGNFASSEACQATIDAFARVPGYSAESFRTRTALLDRAMTDCAEIDVRPTPLMGSLDAKLKAGMSSFNSAESPTPDWLKRSVLPPDRPLWKTYEEEPKFVPRVGLLRGYVAHKALLMDVVEAAEPPDLDTTAAVARIARACEAVPPDERYGVSKIQLVAVNALYDRWHQGRLREDVSPVSRVLMKQYPPEGLRYPDSMALAQLFAIGDRMEPAEWDYLFRTGVMEPSMRRGLEVPDHGGAEVRRQRFRAALERTLAGVEAKHRPRRFEHVLPNDGTLLLQIEPDLPQDLKAHLTWPFLKELFHRAERRMPPAEERAFLARMEVALALLPDEASGRRARCLGLADDLDFLAEQGRETKGHGGLVCTCLADVLGQESLTLVNRHDLYEIALAEGLPCVAPLP